MLWTLAVCERFHLFAITSAPKALFSSPQQSESLPALGSHHCRYTGQSHAHCPDAPGSRCTCGLTTGSHAKMGGPFLLCSVFGATTEPTLSQRFSPTLPALDCPTHYVYTNCFPHCPPTCDNPEGRCKGSSGPSICQEGCVCEPGYVQKQRRCVPRSQCGCRDARGRDLPVSGEWEVGVWGGATHSPSGCRLPLACAAAAGPGCEGWWSGWVASCQDSGRGCVWFGCED